MPVANTFAVFYIVAQVIERIVEFLKNGLGAYDKARADIETHTLEIEYQKKIIDKTICNGEKADAHYKKLNTLIRQKNKMDNQMVWHFFVYTSIMGILAAALLNIRFLELLNIISNPLMDTIITGLVIGSGTKPLHDLIKYIENRKG